MRNPIAIALFGAAVLIPLRAAAAPHGVRLTLSGNPATNMAVSWNSDNADDTEIIYGTSSDALTSSLTAQQSFVQGSPLNHAFTVTLTGLDPSTTYHYRVGSAGNYHPAEGEEPFSFTTLPADPCTPFTFVLIGDNRADLDGIGPNAIWADILAESLGHDPDFFVNTGDMVKNGNDPVEWAAFIDMSEPGWAYVPSILVSGNHDDYAYNGPDSFFGQLFEFPANSQNDWENYYSVDVGPIHFAALDSNASGTDFTDMVSWLDGDLSASSLPWKMAVDHHAIYSRGNHFTGEEDNGYLNAALIPVFDAHHIDFVFNGHSHNYERYAPTIGVDSAWGASAPERSFPNGDGAANGPGSTLPDGAVGTTYMVSGGAGALTTELGPFECIDAGCTWCTGINFYCDQDVLDLDKAGTAIYDGRHNFGVFTVDADRIDVEVWSTTAGLGGDPELIDNFTMWSSDFGDLCGQGPVDAGPGAIDAASGDDDADIDPPPDSGGSGNTGDKAGGCGCDSTPAAPSLLLALGIALLLGWRRRRST